MDFLLKQRLVGAVVLVALGVIFIPMLLEGPRTVVPEMEPFPQASEAQPVRPLQSFPPADAIPEEPQQVVLSKESVQPVSPEPEPVAEPEPEPEPLVEPSEAAQTPPTAKPGPLDGWLVQVGSFSSEKNAMGLRDRLRKAGYATQVEKVRIQGKLHYRVRVGPFLEKQEAEKILRELQKKLQLKGRVLAG